MAEIPELAELERPRGIYETRVDDKGRLNLPSDFYEYLTKIEAKKVFMTSFDERIGRIYTIPDWKKVEALLNESGEHAEDAEDMLFIANDLGRDVEMDKQGRLLIPAPLRRALNAESRTMWLECQRGHINLFAEEVYKERKQRADTNRAEKLKALTKKGLL